MRNQPITDQQREDFYAAALVGLHALESRERRPRRFGEDADARWQSFCGHLDLGDRIDLLVRDAAVTWQAAFSPALVFGLPCLARDEPFGPDWDPLPPHRAEQLWRAPAAADLLACARALGVEETPLGMGGGVPPCHKGGSRGDPRSLSCPDPEPATRLIVAGGSAILAVARRFEATSELRWPDQVAVVAERPENRQLAGLVAPVIGAQAPTRILSPGGDVAATLREAGFTAACTAVVSADATPAARDFAIAAGQGS